jgi:predicted dehydrogenase
MTVRSSQRYSVGIIGAGQIVFDAHLPALTTLSNVEVAWIVDKDEERARRLGRSFRVRTVPLPSDVRALPDADIVLLAIPFGVRAPLYPTLSERFSAIYVEKPFALTLPEHDALCALFSPDRLACGYQKRSWGPVRAMRELVRSKVFGGLISMKLGFGSPGTRTAGRYSSSLQLAGGGVLFEVGVHYLDIGLHVTDTVAVEATKVRMEKQEGIDVETEATLELTNAAGAKIPFDIVVSSLRYTSMNHTFRFEHAEVTFASLGNGEMRVSPIGGGPSFTLDTHIAHETMTSNHIFHAHWSRFVEGIGSGRSNVTSALDSRTTTLAVEQLYARGG